MEYYRKRFGRILPLLVCLLTTLFSFPLYAAHIIGGEMTYRFIEVNANGQNAYVFTLVVYRDCDSGGGQLDNPARIGVYRGTANGAVLVNSFNAPRQGIQNVNPVIPPCADGSQVSNACVQRGTYVFNVTLDVLPDESYFIVYQRCCRTADIVNISNPAAFGATYMVELSPEAQALQNSSPTFLNYPPTFICNNFDLNFDHSAIDEDGDSLAYSFCTPLHGGGQNGGGGGCNTPTPNPPCGPPFATVNFIGTFSEQQPLGGDPVVAVDPVTGLLSGTPTTIGQFVVGICVQEYRNGVLIGSILRDFQFNVVDCAPTVFADIVAEEVTGPQEFLVKRCNKQVITILNQSPQTPDLASWQWEFDLGGSFFVSNNWNVSFAIPDYGEYFGHLYLNRGLSCEDTAFIRVLAFPGSDAAFSFDWDVCSETPVQFTDSSASGAAGGLVDRFWVFPSLGDTLDILHPLVQFPAPGAYPVSLHVTDADGCSDVARDTVVWNPQPPPMIPTLPAQKRCLPETAAFTLLDSLDMTGNTVLWDFGDGQFSSEISPTHAYGVEGVYDVSLRITTALDCVSADTFEQSVQVYDPPLADFEYSPQTQLSNLNNRVAFMNLSSPDVTNWNWTFGDEGTSFQPEPTYAFRDTGLTPVTLIVSNGPGCSDTLTRVLDIVPVLQIYIPNVFAPQHGIGPDNDRFGVMGVLPGYKDFHMQIWSRWGELVYESRDASDPWNGRMDGSGNYLPMGVYVYRIAITGPRGEPFHWEGTVTVL